MSKAIWVCEKRNHFGDWIPIVMAKNYEGCWFAAARLQGFDEDKFRFRKYVPAKRKGVKL